MADIPSIDTITLGILAGGRATRLGGLDKAWLQRDGLPQVLRWRDRFLHEVAGIMVSANHQLQRYREVGLDVVADGPEGGSGPMAGLAALSGACRTPWLLTIPVDLVATKDSLLQRLLVRCAADGAHARDDDGPQPLVALWRVAALRPAVQTSIETREFSVQALQHRLEMASVLFSGFRFGNLNTPDDLVRAGVHPMESQR